MSEISRGSLTQEQVAAHTDALQRHYGEIVRPVSQYCNAFRNWQRVLGEKLEREGVDLTKPSEFSRGRMEGDAYFLRMYRALQALELPIMKSSLLARTIYDGEAVRTRMCPEHSGIWSGIGPCKHGCEMTGWIRE